jgi:hypothetical protein
LLLFIEKAYENEGNLLMEKSTTTVNEAMRRKMSSAHNKFEDIFQITKTSEEGMDILIQNLESLSLLFEPTVQTTQQEQENFIGMCISDDVQAHPPNDIHSKQKCKRILGHGDKNKKKKNSALWKCIACKDVGHDRHNCPNKNVPAM